MALKIGKIVGYGVIYFIFTTVLYFILNFFNKIPESWTYFHIIFITLIIVGIGKSIRAVLK